MQIPVDAESTPELMDVLESQKEHRRTNCPFIFHGLRCGQPRFDRKGRRRPCLGDFQKVWDRGCIALGYRQEEANPASPGKVKVVATRIPHDLRRSGVKHYIEAGVDPLTVMKWSGHRTLSMLIRYNILDLEDLRRAGRKASDYQGQSDNVARPDFSRGRKNRHRTGTVRANNGRESAVRARRS
jgi:integrase